MSTSGCACWNCSFRNWLERFHDDDLTFEFDVDVSFVSRDSHVFISQIYNTHTHTHSGVTEYVEGDRRFAGDASVSTWEWLLHPMDPERFFREWFEKKPVVFRRDSKHYEWLNTDLSSLEEMIRIQNQVKNRADLLHPETGVTQVKIASYNGASMVDRTNKYQDERSALQDGATLVCDLIPAYWKPASELSMSLLQDKSHSPGFAFLTNMYVTPEGNNQGFGKHNDNKDVFIIQLAGRKKWYLQKSTFPLPLRHQCVGRSHEPSADTVTVPDEEIESLVLEPGDLLFVPRGYVHWAQTMKNTTSMHWTLSATLNSEWTTFLDAFLDSFLFEPEEEEKCLDDGAILTWMREHLLNHLTSETERAECAYLRSAVMCDRENITDVIESTRQRLEHLFYDMMDSIVISKRVWNVLNQKLKDSKCMSRSVRAVHHAFRSEKAGLKYIESLLLRSLRD